MNFTQINSNLSLFGIGVGILVFSILFFSKEKKKTSKFLAFSVFATVMLLVLRYLLLIKNPIFHYFTFIAFPAIIAIGPISYLYTVSLLYSENIQAKRILKHLSASIVIFLIHISMMQIFPELNNTSKVLVFKEGLFRAYAGFVSAFSVTIITIYIIIALLAVHRYIKKAKNQISFDAKEKTRWLQIYLAVMLLVVVSRIVSNLIVFIGGLNIIPLFITGSLFLTGQVYLVAYYLYKKSDILQIAIEPEVTSKYKKQNLDRSALKNYIKKLNEYMEKEKPYLEDKLSIQELAIILNVPAHHISMAINSELKMNFYQYVNTFRLKEAADKLRDRQNLDKSILQIAYESGFQSKASFNRLFKAKFEQTPAEFRRQYGTQIAEGAE